MEQVNFSLLETLVFYGKLENSQQVLTQECQALRSCLSPLVSASRLMAA